MKNKIEFKIALICYRGTGIAILGRLIDLFKNKGISANYTVIISSTSSIDEVKNLMPSKSKYKIIKVFSLLEKSIELKKFIKNNILNIQKETNNIRDKKFKIKPRKVFKLKSILIIFSKIILRIVDINLMKLRFKNEFFDYAIFQNDRTNNILTHLIQIFNKNNIKTILPEIAFFSSKFYVTQRGQNPLNYVEENGLFSYLFSDQKINNEKEYMLTMYSPEETIAMYLTKVLPRQAHEISGSLGCKKVIFSSKDLYKKVVNSPFTKSSNICYSLSINEEIALISRNKTKSIRDFLCKKYKLERSKTITLFSLSCLAHTGMFSEKESEEIQLKIINKIKKFSPNCLIMFHPSIVDSRFEKIRHKFAGRIVSESLPYIASNIDIFITVTETSAEQYLLPIGVECFVFIFKKYKMEYGIYDNYRNLHLHYIEDKKVYKDIQKLVKKNHINNNKSLFPDSNIRLFTDCFFNG